MSFLENAHRIAIRLARAAVWRGSACEWVQHFPDGVHRRAGGALYSGSAGTGLFLAIESAHSHSREVRRAATGALRSAMDDARSMVNRPFGLFFGQIGVATSLLNAAAFLDSDQYVQWASELVSAQRDRVGYLGFDLMSGCAGAICGLLSLADFVPQARGIALELGEQLLGSAKRMPDGWAWTNHRTLFPLLGVAHGASGVALALIELYRSSGDQRYAYGFEQAVRYENAHFDRESLTWPDLRFPVVDSYFRRGALSELDDAIRAGAIPRHSQRSMETWCHGSPGVALCRLRARDVFGDGRFESDVERAVSNTVLELEVRSAAPLRWVSDISVCHGIAGMIETLRVASRSLERPELFDLAHDVVGETCERFYSDDFSAPVRDAGLMLGEAGFGLQVLALHSEEVHWSSIPMSGTQRHIENSGARGQAPSRREDAEYWFRRSIAAFTKLGVALEWTPSCEPADVREALISAILHAPSSLQPLMRDAFGLEETRYLCAKAAAYSAPSAVFSTSRTEVMRARRDVMLFLSRWDWDTWLAASADKTLEPSEQWFAVVPSQAGVATIKIYGADALTLQSLVDPAPSDSIPTAQMRRLTQARLVEFC